MSKLHFLSPTEKRQFDSPPVFTKNQRPAYFAVTDDMRRSIGGLRGSISKIGFLLQLGYFKHAGRFFERDSFRQRDIIYLQSQLNITGKLDLRQYSSTQMARHQKRILALLGWSPFYEDNAALVAQHIQLQAQQQIKPEQVFASAVEFCWQHRVEIPTHHRLAEVITDSFNIVESRWLRQIEESLSPEDCNALDAMLVESGDQHSPLRDAKHLSQSVRVKDIRQNASQYQRLSDDLRRFEPCIAALNLSEPATDYYAAWVAKATRDQLNTFPSRWKRYLYLLAFVSHQLAIRQDMLMDIFLKCTRAAANTARKRDERQVLDQRQEREIATRAINDAHKSARAILDEITHVVRDPELSDGERVARIGQLITDRESLQDVQTPDELERFEQLLDTQNDPKRTWEALEAVSLRLQHRVAPILKVLVFDPASSEAEILAAVAHYQATDGDIGSAPPLDFLADKDRNLFDTSNGIPFRISLYKMLLFLAAAAAVRAGKLNLNHSNRYRAIQDYLIHVKTWSTDRDQMLVQAGLEKFADGQACLDGLREELQMGYERVNSRHLSGDNEHLSIGDDGRPRVKTPATDFSEDGTVGRLLVDGGIVPVLQILQDVNQAHEFVPCFKHLSPKHHKLKPAAEIVIAGIMGLGCNIGLSKLAQISRGLNPSTLKNTVTWCFSLKNLQAANNVLVAAIDQMALSNAFQSDPNQLHTSSDGRKVGVAVDSLHANYSFKYFGKDKGVSLYTFIDERHALFYSTVISASEREAAYVIDGLMHNEVIKSDIHSTDTHGYSEAIFAATHLIDTAFAPRIKKVHRQQLYDFSSKLTHQRRGHVIVPSRTIDHKLILQHWDDILRFMATIKLRHSSASQLFRRLSAYAADHPLYRALKEFGRLIKTKFLLTWYDDIALRQRVEKQLNKVELANRFSKAVFFANNQEFQTGSLEEQQIATACKVLIQNAIVLWNALTLSQQLLRTGEQDRDALLQAITGGSLHSWQHVNLQGEYDFRQQAANDEPFDMKKIRALRLR